MTTTLIHAAVLVAASCSRPALELRLDDLTPEMKKELARIEAKLDAVAHAVGVQNRAAIDQSLREIDNWIRDFSLDAELSEADAIIVRLRKTSKDLAESAARRDKAMAEEASQKAKEQSKISAASAPAIKLSVDMANVSFKKDVAPILANVCARCHNPSNLSGKFDATTYASFKQQLEPGDPEASHVLQLVTGKAEPAMPRGGQTRFSKEWADIWTAWIKQGAKFDGPNPAAPIGSYLIDFEAQRRGVVAKMPVADLERLRRAAAQRQIAIARPKKTPTFVESAHFLIHSSAGSEGAEYVAALAEATLEELAKRFGADAVNSSFRGKFSLNALADRADFLAFCQAVDRHSPDASDYGHLVLALDDRHAVIHTDDDRFVDARVAEYVSLAFLRQYSEGKLPPWAAHGYARTVAMSIDAKAGAERKAALARTAKLLSMGKTVKDLFAERLPWSELEPLAVGFFQFLQQTDRKRASKAIEALARHGMPEQALRESFQWTVDEASRRWLAWAKVKSKPAR